ncbi:9032_t:CDS:2, partial [Gigaspora margarita]
GCGPIYPSNSPEKICPTAAGFADESTSTIPGFPEWEYVSNSIEGEYVSNVTGSLVEDVEGYNVSEGKYVSNIVGSSVREYNMYLPLLALQKKTCLVAGSLGEYVFAAAGISEYVTTAVESLTVSIQKIEEILALSNDVRNNINRIRITSLTENERIERTIEDLSNNIHRIREISHVENERIERNILNLSKNINKIHEITQIENERIERNIADLNNNFNRIREKSKPENERIERIITNLNNNVNKCVKHFNPKVKES